MLAVIFPTHLMKPVLNLIVLITNDRKCQKMFDKEYYESTRERDKRGTMIISEMAENKSRQHM